MEVELLKCFIKLTFFFWVFVNETVVLWIFLLQKYFLTTLLFSLIYQSFICFVNTCSLSIHKNRRNCNKVNSFLISSSAFITVNINLPKSLSGLSRVSEMAIFYITAKFQTSSAKQKLKSMVSGYNFTFPCAEVRRVNSSAC